MHNNQLNRLLKLVKRTGDRLVVLDKETESTVVMMEVDEYEKLLDGGPKLEDMSEEDILDKINREVAIWREKNIANSAIVENEDDFLTTENNITEEKKEKTDFSPVLSQKNSDVADVAIENNDAVSPIVTAEEDLSDVPKDDEEEKFYLEPV